MLCANCGTSNRDDEKFCRGCLQPVSAVWQSPKSELLSSAVSIEDGEFAGFWQRLAAVLLDCIFLALLMIPVSILVTLVVTLVIAAMGGSHTSPVEQIMFDELRRVAGFFFTGAAFLGVPMLYYVLMESGTRGATFGKRIMKIRVVDVKGERIGALRAFARYLAHLLSWLTLCIGFLMQPFTARKQALHDMASGTLVVKTDREGSRRRDTGGSRHPGVLELRGQGHDGPRPS